MISTSIKKELLFFIFIIFYLQTYSFGGTHIRINQLGYEPSAVKIAVLISDSSFKIKSFSIHDAITDKSVFTSKNLLETGPWQKFKTTYRLNFTEFNREGIFYIKVGKFKSPKFRIQKGIYNELPDFLLKYIRQQRCGYNPFLKDSCHTQDGSIVYHPKKEGKHIDVVGGWHDASDYLKYVTTSATVVFQLLFAYYKNKDAFFDFVDENGNPNPDGVPDVLNEAIWGVKWLMKMNPNKNEMYHQVADDRDHRGFRLPNEDTISYGKGLERPVYFVTGEPQGLFKYKNRSNGVSSIAGKFSSAFALSAKILKGLNDKLAEELFQKSLDAFSFAETKSGVCQTAPCLAPYFYEEENYFDDMELASAVLFELTGDSAFLKKAIYYGRGEKISPWIGKDTVRHYQFYPFINLGHYFLAKNPNQEISCEFKLYLKEGLTLIKNRSVSNPFRIGVPFVWCSNNLIASILTQFRLYNELTGDDEFIEIEASHRDWLFGCNPWGTSMVVGLPEWGDYPKDPHSAFSAIYGYRIDGGLVDGPVYTSIFKNLIGIQLHSNDEYSEFQTDYIVYHDDYGDYSTNEPTLDGTASLLMYISLLYNPATK